MVSDANRWTLFDSWPRPVNRPTQATVSWAIFACLGAELNRSADQLEIELDKVRRPWDERLKRFGGDPSRSDWTKFRPLRLEREEDFSDWLAWLLEHSRSGLFAQYMFGDAVAIAPAEHEPPRVERELVVEEAGRRADILVDWRDGGWTHVEVKLGDRSFDKTFETALGLRQQRGNPECWTDFILTPEEATESWTACRKHHEGAREIKHITWTSVAIALRRALWHQMDSDSWLAWAYAFCGWIEQRLLDHPRQGEQGTKRRRSATRINRLLDQADFLRTGVPE